MTPAPTQVVGFWHVGITVRDLTASIAFYCDGLGFEVASRFVTSSTAATIWGLPGAHANAALLNVPNSDAQLELFEFTGDIEQRDLAARPWDLAHGHFALFVEDLEGLHQRLVERGYRSRSGHVAVIAEGPQAGASVVYMIDPDGYHVELFERPS